MPFEDCPTDEDLTAWADQEYDGIPRCAQCNADVLDGGYCLLGVPDLTFCSGRCASRWMSDQEI